MEIGMLAAAWGLLALSVVVLFGYRMLITNHEDDNIHLREKEATLVHDQEVLAHKVEVVDRWGKILTVITVLSGMALAATFVYNQWLASSRL
ncbi:MAG: hypothetical protein FJW40_17875 [Acidobacteria bacterium]|nr:hypothetical protein [Acidobacteriota bacterium]